ncbi:hypothetical protein IZ6_25450 [Terrihabitans soli]|uniref:Uncharacterized protein n=1 Tax=Terrihabitans soli TaxID=708113 RepID=A0A6S6QXP7_9HYPH|nr:hypothetical protein [Terrihabitans soli]BCJ91810.1 hypothetical protein IZ6_25450 [Terrihabitans soli]
MRIKGKPVLTGNKRLRRGFLGRAVMQVEIEIPTGVAFGGKDYWTSGRRYWRDARWSDVQTREAPFYVKVAA